MKHPYSTQPDTAFWSRSVARNPDTRLVYTGPTPLLERSDRIMSAGSCFAANIVPWIEDAGFRYLRAERPHPAFAHLAENLGYGNFSAAYGNIYTARQLLQLLLRALGEFSPAEDRWEESPYIIDPYRPGLRFKARSHREFDTLRAQHLRAVRTAFTQASVLIFTLGLTEAWESTADGAVFPACPGTVGGTFDASRHRFRNFRVRDITEDMGLLLGRLRALNPGIRLILTVSPVPLVATATTQHVIAATVASKSILRAAAQEIAESHPGVAYFPAYELITGPQAEGRFFESDRRNVSQEGIATVMQAMLFACGHGEAQQTADDTAQSPDLAGDLSRTLVSAECEEMMMDVTGTQEPRAIAAHARPSVQEFRVAGITRLHPPGTGKSSSRILGAVGQPKQEQTVQGKFLLAGWCAAANRRFSRIIVRSAGSEHAYPAGLQSKDVALKHPSLDGADYCRFRAEVPLPHSDASLCMELLAETSDGSRYLFAEIRLEPVSRASELDPDS